MAEQNKILPIKCNLDIAADHIDNLTARFIKNLTPYVGATNDYAGIKEGQNVAKQKPAQSSEIYVNIPLPKGDNFCIGAKGFPNTSEVYIFGWNSLDNHFIVRLNCLVRTFDMVKVDPFFNFQKQPQYFLGEGQIMLSIIPLVDPDTGIEFTAKELKWTDGFGYQGFCRVQDSIDTDGFNPATIPYFVGNYDKAQIVRMGKPTPKGCITVTEVPRVTNPLDPAYDLDKNNTILFQKWFFSIRETDVWGRISEWGPRSVEYVPGINDCIANSANIPRCLDLEFEITNPFVNSVDIGWLNCSGGTSTVWHKDATIFLYTGSNIGKWWERQRSNVWSGPKTVKYRFCRSKECEIVPPDEIKRLENPLPRRSQAIMDLTRLTSLWNNKSRFNPFGDTLKSKFSAKVIPPAAQTDTGLRNITIYVPIWSAVQNNWFQVNKDGANGYVWGSLNQRRYLQYFKNIAQSGFEGYLVGGGSAVSTQVYVDAAGNLVDDPLFNGINISPLHLSFQKFVFNNVPKGEYIFRLSSTLSDPNSDANYRQTSTTVWGVCPFSRNNNYQISVAQRQRKQELLIDVCDKDYNTMDNNTNEILVISDCSGTTVKATSGYVFETALIQDTQNPIELANVICANGEFISNITDHNGFYYYGTIGSGRTFSIIIRDNCLSLPVANRIIQNSGANMEIKNFIADQAFSDYSLLACNHILIKGHLTLQGTNIGVPNVVVTLTRGQSAVTDDNGNFVIRVHDDVLNGVRNDNVVIGSGGCGYSGQNGICVALINIVIQPCTTCVDRIIDTGTTLLQYLTQQGLLSGGVYGWGAVGWDWLGRATFIQAMGYLTIPTINQSNAIAPSAIQVNIDPTAVFPPETEYITFFITAETTIEKYLSWIVDDVKFIDSTGLENIAAPTQIKIYYGSVIEYSKVNNYNTTTAWQIIPENANTPVISDKAKFFVNGDGKFFPVAITGLIKYQKDGEYFTIDYTSDLQNLKKNALIRLERPKTCTGDEPYYEICNSKVEIVNGIPQRLQFILDAFDTYYVPRQIPIPVPVTTGSVSSVTTTVVSGNTSVATQVIPDPTPTILQLRTFGFRFEHAAPSNFWGDGCQWIGRTQVKNPYEAEVISPYQVALSGGLSINGQLNYLCYFDNSKMTSFEVPEADGIMSAFSPKIGQVYVLMQMGSFIIGFNDNLGRVNANGTFQAASIANEFGKPQNSSEYGCALKDKLSVKLRGDKILFVDRDNADLVRYDAATGKTESLTKDKCDGWFKAKVKYVLASANRYFCGGINPVEGTYLITNTSIGESDAGTTYTNLERTYNALLPETVSFDIETKDIKAWWLFIPEAVAHLDGDILNRQMFTFKQSVPWSHYNGTVNNSFNNFFGVQGEKVVTIIFNAKNLGDGFSKAMHLAISNYCENQLFFSDLITTEAKQVSRLLLSAWEKAAYFSFATFKCNLNSVPDINLPDETGKNVLMDGDRLYGSWITIRLVGDPKDNNRYCEILGFELKSFNYKDS